MPDCPTPSRTRSLTRRWRVPAHYLHSAERFDGGILLEESPGPLGLLLWQCERDVRLWATTMGPQRDGLFVAGAGVRCRAALRSLGAAVRPLEGPIGVIAGMLEHPLDVSAEALMLACRRISQWAEARGATTTALTFAQASALAHPGSASSAYQVGRLARRTGQVARAEGWLNRAIVLARQARDWDTYAAAYSGLGNVNLTRGNLPAAERCQMKALRIATQFELGVAAAGFLHDLFVIAAEANQPQRAESFAAKAFQSYPEDHPKRPVLAHDVALFWIEQGNFRCSMPVLRAVLPRLPKDQQVVCMANAARGAGALKNEVEYLDFSRSALAGIRSAESTMPTTPGAVLNIARGAASLGRWDEARELAAETLHLATELQQNKLTFEAEALLQALASDEAAAGEHHKASTDEAENFAWEVASSLSRRELTSVTG
jgi:tetratricopeptide (TPR) repeat protein